MPSWVGYGSRMWSSVGAVRLAWSGDIEGPIVAIELGPAAIAQAIVQRSVVAHFDARGRMGRTYAEVGAWPRNGRLFSTYGKRRLVELDVEGRRVLREHPRVDATIEACALSPAGRFAVGRTRGFVHVWDLERGTVRHVPSANGGALAAGDDGRVVVAHPEGVVVHAPDAPPRLHPMAPVAALLSRGDAFFALNGEGLVRFGGPEAASSAIRGTCLSALDARTLAVGAADGTVQLVDVETLAPRASIALEGPVSALGALDERRLFAAIGDRVYALCEGDAPPVFALDRRKVRVPAKRIHRVTSRACALRAPVALEALEAAIDALPLGAAIGAASRFDAAAVRARSVDEWRGPEDPAVDALLSHVLAIERALLAPLDARPDALAAIERVRLAIDARMERLHGATADPYDWRRGAGVLARHVVAAVAASGIAGVTPPSDLRELFTWLVLGHLPLAFDSLPDAEGGPPIALLVL